MAVNVGSAIAYLDLDTSRFKNNFQSAMSTLHAIGDTSLSLDTRMSALGNTMTSVGSTMTKTFTLPLTALGTVATKSAIDFETAFTGVKKTVDATAEEYDILSKNIKQMATETASSSTEIAGVMEIAGQLGISLGENGRNITKFTRTMIELGDTTNIIAEEAAVALAQFSNIMGTSEDNIDRLGSSIVALGNNFATDEKSIVDMSTRLASAGKIAGLTEQQVLALATAMSSVGINAEAGGTAMAQTLAAIESAVSNGGDKLQQFADIAGVSAQEFSSSWANDPITALQSFIIGLAELDSQGESATLVLEEMGLSGIRQSNMLKALALSSENLAKAVDVSNNAWDENIALSDEAEKRYGTTESRLKQLKESFNNVAIEIGEILLPYLEKLVDWLQNVIDWWNGLSDAQKNVVVTIGLVVAAIGPLVTVLGSLLKLVAEFKLIGGMSAIFSGASGAAGFVSTAAGATTAMTTFTGSAVAAGGAATTVTTILGKAGGALKSLGGAALTTGAALATFDTIKNPVIRAIGAITGDTETSAKMIERYGYAGDTFRIIGDSVDILKKKMNGMPAVLDGVEFSAKALGEALDNINEGVIYTDEQLEEMHERWKFNQEDMETLRQAMIDANPDIVSVTEKFTMLNDASVETLQQVSAGLTAMSENGKTVDDVLTGNVKTVKGLGQQATAFFNTIKNDAVEVQTSIGTINEKILDQSGKLNETGKNLIKGLASGIESETINASAKTGSVAEKLIIEPIKGSQKDAEEAAKNVILGFNNTIDKAGNTTAVKVTDWIASSVVDTIHTELDEHSPSKKSENSAKNTILGFNNGIANNSGSTSSYVSDWLGDLVSMLGGFSNNSSIYQLGYNTMITLLNGMQDGWNNAKSWLNTQLGTVANVSRTSSYFGSHEQGLDYVPYNGYMAQLHEGERVLTAQENKQYSIDKASGGDTFIFNSPKPIDAYEATRLLKQTKMELDL